MAVTEVLTRDISSGRFHKRYREDGGAIFSLESDNLDDAGDFEEVDESVLADAEPGQLCERCFSKPVTFAQAGLAEGVGEAT